MIVPPASARLEHLRAYVLACVDEGLLPRRSLQDVPALAAGLARRVAEDAAFLVTGASLGQVAGSLLGQAFGGAFGRAVTDAVAQATARRKPRGRGRP